MENLLEKWLFDPTVGKIVAYSARHSCSNIFREGYERLYTIPFHPGYFHDEVPKYIPRSAQRRRRGILTAPYEPEGGVRSSSAKSGSVLSEFRLRAFATRLLLCSAQPDSGQDGEGRPENPEREDENKHLGQVALEQP